MATPEEKAERLLNLAKQPLGDQRASLAFQEMKALSAIPQADGTFKQLPLLTVLWLLRLPDAVRNGITQFTEKTEEEITTLADSLQGATLQSASRRAFAVPEGETSDEDEMAAAAGPASSRRKSYKYSSQSFNRPKINNNPSQSKPLRGIPPKKASLQLCWFHERFGSEAWRCKNPCSWSKNS